MRKTQLVLPFFLFFAPLIVALVQTLALDFPKESPFSGIPYSPYPQVLYFPLFGGMVLMILGITNSIVIGGQRYRNLSFNYRLLIAVLLIAIYFFFFWFGINLAQRAVIVEYISVINANGLHFLGDLSLPILPQVFPNNSELTYGVTITLGVIGLVSMIIQYVVLLRHNSK